MNERMRADFTTPLRVDPQSLMQNPHAAFAALRQAHPVIQIGDGRFMALRAHDVLALLTDERTKQVDGTDYVRMGQIPDGFTARFLSDVFLFANGDEHRAKRRLFARTFAHGAMRAAQMRIRRVADTIVAELPRRETFDFVDRMSARVPAEMIAAILGLPAVEVPYFAGRVYDIALALTPVYPQARHATIEAAAKDLFEYIEKHLRARMLAPGDDLLSELVRDWQGEQAIPLESLVHQVLGIIIGGSDTTRAGFAMLVALLLQRPDAWAALRQDESLIPGAVSESMRYEPPVGSIARFTIAPVDVGGVGLPAGVLLGVSTLSAMRDPTLYANPDHFDIRRADHARLHPVFGLGPHRCIGEMLARLEMQEGLAALIAGASDIELLAPPKMIGFGGIRQITPMPVRIP